MAHLFVVHGDLMALACDAWLVPGSFTPGVTWHRALPPPKARLPLPPGWGDAGGPRACLLAEVAPPEPLPFLCDITADDRHDPDWWVSGARDFVRVAARTLDERKRPAAFGRARHLVALPLVGTGGGGASHLSGEIVGLLIGALRAEAQATGVDVALVLNDGAAWAAAQNARKGDVDAFGDLASHLVEPADRLAKKARSGDLVLFLGAGVSYAAGLPDWGGLLAELGAKFGLGDPAAQRALAHLGELDRAAVIARRLPKGLSVGEAVAQLIADEARRHALAHALLASMPVDEVVTTNYDDLFERASKAAGRPCTVLPGGAIRRGERWILKMHGSVQRPETIVLTRADYLKFQETRSALAGIVQALLLTRHMLFVGFSLHDDNFHRIAHTVRQALGSHKRFGTTLVVDPNPLAHELWREDLGWIGLDQGAPDTAAQRRMLEIFLDRLACQAAAATSHLGQHRYEGALSPGERRLRDRLFRLRDDATLDERATGAWLEVERLLDRLGIEH